MEESVSHRVTLEQYLAHDTSMLERLEYRGGVIVALAVPTRDHGRIAGNIASHLGPLARARGCDYFAGDAKVITPRGDRLIPDFVITCDDRDVSADSQCEAQLRHPWLIVEILSPTTAADDMTYKLDAYHSIAEVSHYVVIDSRRRSLRVFERATDGSFNVRSGLDMLILPRLAAEGLPIDRIYLATNIRRIADLD